MSIRINFADVEELMALPGVSEKQARDIVRKRKKHGYLDMHMLSEILDDETSDLFGQIDFSKEDMADDNVVSEGEQQDGKQGIAGFQLPHHVHKGDEQQDGKEGIAGFTLPHPVQKLMSLAEVVSPKKEKGIVGFQLPHPVQELMSLAEVGSPTKEKGIAGFQLPHPVQKLISSAEVGSLKKEKNTELESLFGTQLSVKPKVLKNALQGNLELSDSLPDPPVSKNNKTLSVNTKPVLV
ncbi:hypothetical protein DPMN_048832 [Dreissena polymorpha]|uniref:Uncharacterized protein n=1 Tax=Dreissena polymorpha TaxID=45954 RepID=A0A9D4DE38_DREPO|nr:hypothetical protein DPMN_048832 [Dreissena polymorpha]